MRNLIFTVQGGEISVSAGHDRLRFSFTSMTAGFLVTHLSKTLQPSALKSSTLTTKLQSLSTAYYQKRQTFSNVSTHIMGARSYTLRQKKTHKDPFLVGTEGATLPLRG